MVIVRRSKESFSIHFVASQQIAPPTRHMLITHTPGSPGSLLTKDELPIRRNRSEIDLRGFVRVQLEEGEEHPILPGEVGVQVDFTYQPSSPVRRPACRGASDYTGTVGPPHLPIISGFMLPARPVPPSRPLPEPPVSAIDHNDCSIMEATEGPLDFYHPTYHASKRAAVYVDGDQSSPNMAISDFWSTPPQLPSIDLPCRLAREAGIMSGVSIDERVNVQQALSPSALITPRRQVHPGYDITIRRSSWLGVPKPSTVHPEVEQTVRQGPVENVGQMPVAASDGSGIANTEAERTPDQTVRHNVTDMSPNTVARWITNDIARNDPELRDRLVAEVARRDEAVSQHGYDAAATVPLLPHPAPDLEEGEEEEILGDLFGDDEEDDFVNVQSPYSFPSHTDSASPSTFHTPSPRFEETLSSSSPRLPAEYYVPLAGEGRSFDPGSQENFHRPAAVSRSKTILNRVRGRSPPREYVGDYSPQENISPRVQKRNRSLTSLSLTNLVLRRTENADAGVNGADGESPRRHFGMFGSSTSLSLQQATTTSPAVGIPPPNAIEQPSYARALYEQVKYNTREFLSKFGVMAKPRDWDGSGGDYAIARAMSQPDLRSPRRRN